MCFYGDLLATFCGIVDRLIKCAFGGIDELGKRILELCGSLGLGGYLVDHRLRFSVGLDPHFTHHPLIWDDEGSSESRKRHNFSEFHFDVDGTIGRCEQERGLMPKVESKHASPGVSLPRVVTVVTSIRRMAGTLKYRDPVRRQLRIVAANLSQWNNTYLISSLNIRNNGSAFGCACLRKAYGNSDMGSWPGG